MKLYYYQDPKGKINFGDDLNPWIWNKLCPELFNEDDRSLFIGIGTLINSNIPKGPKKVVFSSGVGYGDAKQIEINNEWDIHCVRGPLSAKELGINKDKAILDGAYLLKNIITEFPEKKFDFSYMPHFHYANQYYKDMCEKLGIHYIDPSQNIEQTLSDILSTKVLFSEAMHGAIVADCFNIPWVPIRTNKKILSFKWEDWCQSLELNYSPIDIAPLWDSNKSIIKKIYHRYKLHKNIKLFNTLKENNNTFNSNKNILNNKFEALNAAFNNLVIKYQNEQ